MLSQRQRSTIATTLAVLGILVLPFGMWALAMNGYVVLMAASVGLLIAGILVGKAGKRT